MKDFTSATGFEKKNKEQEKGVCCYKASLDVR